MAQHTLRLILTLSLWGFGVGHSLVSGQVLTIPNEGQWNHPALAVTPLAHGALFWDELGYRAVLWNGDHHTAARTPCPRPVGACSALTWARRALP
jgi:hypothetical protein